MAVLIGWAGRTDSMGFDWTWLPDPKTRACWATPAWAPAPISRHSPANLVLGIFLLDPECVGDKSGGMKPSPVLVLVDPYTLVHGHQFHLLCYHSELQGRCGQTKRQGLELVCPTLYMNISWIVSVLVCGSKHP